MKSHLTLNNSLQQNGGASNKMSVVLTCLLFLFVSGPFRAARFDPATAFVDTQMEEVLIKGSWSHDVRLGRVAVESRVLTFCGGGHVRERILDDTGIHDLYGTWTLERSADGLVLVLSGDQLRDRGRFPVKYSEKEKAIELRLGSGERTLRFRSVSGDPHPLCTAPN